ncbi:MAG: DUF4301 family protein [Crocinitomicaceae bacterium]|nr:DUF4301 family protein [Crocinitomicaceae bacterium]
MSKDSQQEIEKQRKQVFQGDFKVDLKTACTVGNGVVQLKPEQEAMLLDKFDNLKTFPSFFIPASGSGSRMFQFLYEWLENGQSTKDVEEFFSVLDQLALSDGVNLTEENRESIVRSLLTKYADQPKGLIPFHKEEEIIKTAFQEHVLQAQQISGDQASVHFTVQHNVENVVNENISQLGPQTKNVNISYSYQKVETDSYCFNEQQELVMHGGVALRRPAGHGALLNNLDDIDADIVLIKNVDNIQHSSRSSMSGKIWKLAVGLLLQMKEDLKTLSDNYSQEALEGFNNKYQLFSEEEMKDLNSDAIISICNRPSRVCGMVKNEGEPGGGPFWINDDQGVTKQIVEKVQIDSSNAEQLEIVQNSSHFNPVFIAVSKTNTNGGSVDLMKYRDDSKFFVVNKSHQGEAIAYRELPGLWNGGMNNWNTIFLEIPSEVFSPVKTVLDLAKSSHQEG